MNAGILIVICCMLSCTVMFSQNMLCGPLITFGTPKSTDNTCRNIHGIVSCILCLFTIVGLFTV